MRFETAYEPDRAHFLCPFPALLGSSFLAQGIKDRVLRHNFLYEDQAMESEGRL